MNTVKHLLGKVKFKKKNEWESLSFSKLKDKWTFYLHIITKKKLFSACAHVPIMTLRINFRSVKIGSLSGFFLHSNCQRVCVKSTHLYLLGYIPKFFLTGFFFVVYNSYPLYSRTVITSFYFYIFFVHVSYSMKTQQ